jgi:hypothetical protein
MTRRLWWALILVLAVATPSYAQLTGGVRAGVSGTPNQFVFGGHVETKELAEHLTFRPNVEIGVGNGGTLVGINIEFAYWLPTKTDPWRFYLGGGPAAIIVHVSNVGTSSGGGFNLLVGAQHKGGLFTELKAGMGDSPNVKFMVGYQFKSK